MDYASNSKVPTRSELPSQNKCEHDITLLFDKCEIRRGILKELPMQRQEYPDAHKVILKGPCKSEVCGNEPGLIFVVTEEECYGCKQASDGVA